MKFIRFIAVILICLGIIGIAFIGAAKSPGYNSHTTPLKLEQIEEQIDL